tara:strand:- start:972 stop:1148 length:177 start_codon:yes stop_codon:yes gene_type:complete
VKMISANLKKRLRHLVLIGTILSFPLLYIGPITLENSVITLAGLALATITAIIAWLVF